MERASQALAAMDYPACEQACLEALRRARQARDWNGYARILLPLQEARRQRRLIAAEGFIRLGTSDLEGPDHDWSATFAAGCILVTHPHTAPHAVGLIAALRQQHKHAQVLLADNILDAPRWVIASPLQPLLRVELAAPPTTWTDRWLSPRQVRDLGEPGPDDYFLDAAEALGDAAMAQVASPLGSVERIEQLEQFLEAVSDHEILHQRLGEAARAALRAS